MTVDLAARPMLRLLPVPPLDPPYDDEREQGAALTDGSLALAFPAPSDALPLRLVPPALPRPAAEPAEPLPDPDRWCRRLSQAIVEVLAGARPPVQLSQVTTLDVLHQLERWSGRFARRPGQPTVSPRVVSVRVSEPRDGVAEACAIVDTCPRRRAFALRLEAQRGRWTCVALELG